MQINAYFKSVLDSAVEIRKFHVADWFAKPAILGSLAYLLYNVSNGLCYFVTCSKYGCRQFLPVESKLFSVSRLIVLDDGPNGPYVVLEFKNM